MRCSIALAVAWLAIGLSSASADTIVYTYTGADYTSRYGSNPFRTGTLTDDQLQGAAQNLGPRMTITVSLFFPLIDIETHSLNGTFQVAPDFVGSDYISAVTAISGQASASRAFPSTITFHEGTVTSWDI